ncbi:hypothetical protein BRADI_1g63495v3 [Brachypodium distachyon]|uniref:Uncharacterized protein n=1 Tax=Brachypodium distachyon TaxID=15368 RepID=A0A0Q3LFV2_BRADI|nr:hypothetical protein BRADI_1g63495v3 [Brachypodium distachyon]
MKLSTCASSPPLMIRFVFFHSLQRLVPSFLLSLGGGAKIWPVL